jgi:RNA polymerase sigma-70 factor (ECF subfamily)
MGDEDRERFEALFRQHYAAVVRYAARRLGPDAAAEVVSETFLTAWRRLDDVPEPALAWLYGTARRLAANEIRRCRRQVRLGERISREEERATSDPSDAITDRLRVQAALAALSLRDAEVLRLVEWEGLGPADAAEVMGCTQAALRVRLHRARRRLGAVLGADEAEVSTLVVQGGTS